MANKVFGYIRVSTSDQNLTRQREQMKEFVSDDRYIIEDESTGKNFNRKGYNSLVGTENTAPLLDAGDLLIITSLDRLGRDYKEIREQWTHITQVLGADIKVLEMPLLDTSAGAGDLDRKFIADLALQILSYVAEKERLNIKSRQRQGIDVMPIIDGKRTSTKTGRPTGRPNAKFPKRWDEIYKRWCAGEITAVAAMKELGLKKATYYSLVKRYEQQHDGQDDAGGTDNRQNENDAGNIDLSAGAALPLCNDDLNQNTIENQPIFDIFAPIEDDDEICAGDYDNEILYERIADIIECDTDDRSCSNCKFAQYSKNSRMFRCRNKDSKLNFDFVGEKHVCELHEYGE